MTIKVNRTDGIIAETYELVKFDEPSTWRWICWILLDLSTAFLWEIPWTILEATVCDGEEYYLTVVYKNDMLVDYSIVMK